MNIWGWHAVLGLLNTKPNSVKQVCIAHSRRPDARYHEVAAVATQYHIPLVYRDRIELDEKCGLDHQGIMAELQEAAAVTPYQESNYQDLIENSLSDALILLLDGVQDPHNLGACLRSAAAANVRCVIAPKDKSVGITPVVRKVACGAAEIVPFITVTNLSRTMKELRELGVWIYGFDGEAKTSVYDAGFKGPVALAMGAEDRGLRRLTQENCDVLVKIPMPGKMESLNVSVATGIALFEVCRQRR